MTHYITQAGLDSLQEEISHLKDVLLPEIIETINRAMSDGDLKENAPLEAAKTDRDNIMLRIGEIEEILANYEIIDETSVSKSKTVKLGSVVKIRYIDENREFELKIVGGSEADALSNKISNESPLAHAILGKGEGQQASFKVKQRPFSVKILQIIS